MLHTLHTLQGHNISSKVLHVLSCHMIILLSIIVDQFSSCNAQERLWFTKTILFTRVQYRIHLLVIFPCEMSHVFVIYIIQMLRFPIFFISIFWPAGMTLRLSETRLMLAPFYTLLFNIRQAQYLFVNINSYNILSHIVPERPTLVSFLMNTIKPFLKITLYRPPAYKDHGVLSVLLNLHMNTTLCIKGPYFIGPYSGL